MRHPVSETLQYAHTHAHKVQKKKVYSVSPSVEVSSSSSLLSTAIKRGGVLRTRKPLLIN